MMGRSHRRIISLYITMLRNIALATCLGLLSACAATPGSPPAPPEPQQNAAGAGAAATPEIPERAFPEDSLYPLLVAEFAIRRRAFDVALENYMALAPELRDAGVSAHTTNLGQYMQRYDAALEAAQLWVELEPDSVEANSTLASLLVRQGQAARALPYLAMVERNGTQARFPALLAGYDDLSSAEQEQLAAGINELAAEFPDNTELLLTQALLHTEAQQYDRALAKLDRILELEPKHSTALIMEAEILLNQQARKPFARIERTLRSDPGDSTLRMQYARMLTSTDLNAAKEQFEVLSEQAPEDADLLFSLALLNREIGDYDAASAYLQQVIALNTRVGEAYYYLGKIEEDRGRPLAAVTYYEEIEEGREFLPANKRLAELLVEQGRIEQLKDVFATQRQRYPSLSEPLYTLEADVLGNAGYTDEAIRRLNGALELIPDSTALLYARAMTLEKVGALDAMERDLRTILAREPDNATAMNALGYTLANRTERYDEALALITRALNLEPNEPAILDSMGWVLYRKGRNEEALGYLSRAYAMFPDPEVAAHLGELLWVTGDTRRALEIWQGAALRDPDHPTLVETLQRLGATLPQVGPNGAPDSQ